MNPRKKFDKQMRLFLLAIDNGDVPDYNDPNVRRCVYECHNKGYVAGFKNCSRADSNKIYFDVINPCLEKSGYDYLYPKTDWLAIGTLLTGFLTALGVLLQLILSLQG